MGNNKNQKIRTLLPINFSPNSKSVFFLNKPKNSRATSRIKIM